MRVKFVADYEVRLSSIESKTYPKDWEGDVDDVIGEAAVAAGKAIRAAVLPEGGFTADETAALKAVASNVLANAAQHAAEGPQLDFNTMETADLRRLAEDPQVAIPNARRLGRDKLIAALEARRAEMQAEADGADAPVADAV